MLDGPSTENELILARELKRLLKEIGGICDGQNQGLCAIALAGMLLSSADLAGKSLEQTIELLTTVRNTSLLQRILAPAEQGEHEAPRN